MAEKAPSTLPTADEQFSMEPKFLECGLCFENDDLKRLTCHPDHIYCVTCLTKDSELTKIIKCPLCRFGNILLLIRFQIMVIHCVYVLILID
jgi:hypothetical protein